MLKTFTLSRRFARLNFLKLPGLAVIVAVMLLAHRKQAFAHEETTYQYKISTTVIAALSWGEQAKDFVERHGPFVFRADKPITESNLMTEHFKALMIGKYRMPKRTINVEFHAEIDRGILETTQSINGLDKFLYAWEQKYETNTLFKKFMPIIRNVTYHQDEGIDYEILLKTPAEFLVLMTVPIENGTLIDKSEELKKIKKFVDYLISETRNKIVIGNNRSTLPVYVGAVSSTTFQARHPMHQISWVPGNKEWQYTFLDPWSQVKLFPELKRMAADKKVKAFLEEQGEDVKINLKGNSRTGYQVVFVAQQGKKILKVTMDKKRMVVE